jgi:hypothetical protein
VVLTSQGHPWLSIWNIQITLSLPSSSSQPAWVY